MKHITKNSGPSSFRAWNGNKPHGADWNFFSKTDVYRELRQYLVDEQDDLCCYCEIALKNDAYVHIEHFKPKSTYPAEMFDIQNLFACCQYNDSCGHKKGSGFFDELVSPLDTNCRARFTYTGNGKIIPLNENDISAQQTIDLLGLNCKRLKDRRRSIMRTLDNAGVTTDYLKESLDNCIEWYDGFFTVIEYVAGKQE